MEKKEASTKKESPRQIFALLERRYGSPYYKDPKGKVTLINQSFWAGLNSNEHIQLYEPNEKAFYRYDEKTGLYDEVSEDLIKQEISQGLLKHSRAISDSNLEKKRTDGVLKSIVGHLRGICEKRDVFTRKGRKIVHLANGVLQFSPNGKFKRYDFSPKFFSRNQSPILFNKSAQCPRFLNELLHPSVSADDAVLVQKYMGLSLLGKNLIQRFLIYDGIAGSGKSTLALINQRLVGLNNVTQLRTKHLDERFEIYRYLKKTLLVGVDVSGNFLSDKGSSVIKGLVGGDLFDAEKKCNPQSFQVQGNFCILITSNTRLQVRFDGDMGAWRRRLMIVRFDGPPPKKKIPNFDEVLMKEESSGILNFALDGLTMLLDDIERLGDIKLTDRQQDVVDTLLAESDGLRYFLSDRVIQESGHELTVSEILEGYAQYCKKKQWNPKPSTVIHKELEGLMLELFATCRANSLWREGGYVKGFRRVRFKG